MMLTTRFFGSAILLSFCIVLGTGTMAPGASDAIAVVTSSSGASAERSGDSKRLVNATAEFTETMGRMPTLPQVIGYPAELSAIWMRAANEHPSIRLMMSEALALEQRILPAGAPPDPMLSVSLMGYPVANPFRWDSPMVNDMISIEQMLERSSKRKARRTVAELDVEVQQRRIESARYAIGESLLDNWFDLAEVSVQLDKLGRNEALLGALLDIARLEYEVNRAPQADMLAAESEVAGISIMRAELNAMRETLIADLASAAGLAVNDLPSLEAISLPQLGVVLPEEWAAPLAVVAAEHPDSRLYDALEAQLRSQLEVLRLNYKPDLTIETGWSYNPKGQDTISLKLSIPLLLHNDERNDPQVKESHLREDQIKIMREELAVNIRGAVQVEAAKLRTLPAQRRALEALALPLLRQTFDSQLGAYQTGKVRFSELILTALDTVEAETSLLLLDVEEARATAKLDYYTLGLLRRESDGSPI